MAKATSSQAWLWHGRLSHLNIDTINLLSKYNIVTGLPKLNSSKIIFVLLVSWGKVKESLFTLRLPRVPKDGYKFYRWTYVVLYGGIHAQVRTVRTEKGTKFLNKTLHAYFAKEGIRHETSTARTPEQNGIVKRRNRTLVKADRTILSAAKVPLFFWAKAITTACFTQNRSLVIPRHEKIPYHIINGRKSSVKVFNKRTRVIFETIHVNFDELPQMVSDHVISDPIPQCTTTVLERDSLCPDPQSQENVHQAAEIITTSNELDLLFSPMFDALLNGTTLVVSIKGYAPRKELISEETFGTVARGTVRGIQIHQSPHGIFINQAKYAQEILKKHGMTSCDSIGTPMATKHLDADMSDTLVDQMKYHTKPTEKHLTMVKRIFRYLKDSINMGLWYPKDTAFELTAFLDSDHACCLDSRKSTSGGIQFIGGDKLVS
ncbi:retrovirus-related pol polyprotein from transposon TNT 1-94 [Tanacetum coccineum]